MNILLTGFEPFDAEGINPSWEVARALGGWREGGAQVHARQLPCVFGRSRAVLDQAIDEVAPTLVVALGQAGGRAEITPERVAINIDDGRIPDNAGHQAIDLAVIPGAPAAYFSTLPIKAIVRALRDAGVPASVSNSAGTFVCNHLFFGLMHRLATRAPASPATRTRGGFIHLPYLPAQAARLPGSPSLALDTQIDGVRLALRAALAHASDIRDGGGRLH